MDEVAQVDLKKDRHELGELLFASLIMLAGPISAVGLWISVRKYEVLRTRPYGRLWDHVVFGPGIAVLFAITALGGDDSSVYEEANVGFMKVCTILWWGIFLTMIALALT
jgi:hypothetical protein